jgi:hypothetical protein
MATALAREKKFKIQTFNSINNLNSLPTLAFSKADELIKAFQLKLRRTKCKLFFLNGLFFTLKTKGPC